MTKPDMYKRLTDKLATAKDAPADATLGDAANAKQALLSDGGT